MKKSNYIILLTLLITRVAYSQNSVSPFSNYGIGLVEKPTNVNQKILGGIGNAYIPISGVNLSNPAFGGYLKETYFDLGLTSYSQRIREGNVEATNRSAGFSHVQLFFPIQKDKWGFGFGLSPYSRVGFLSRTTQTTNDFTSSNLAFASGGINTFNLSLSRKLKVDSLSTLSLGLQGNFMFGNIQKTKSITFNQANAFSYLNEQSSFSKGSGIKFGLMADRKLSDLATLGVGFTYSSSINLKTEVSEIGTSYQTSFVNTIDTISFANSSLESTIPTEIGLGISLKLGEVFTFYMDYNSQNWKNFSYTKTSETYSNQTEIGVGGQILLKRKKDGLADPFRLSVGAKQKQHYIQISGSDLVSQSATLGFGIPISSKVKYNRSKSMITFGTEIGSFTNGAIDAQYSELFYNLYAGFTLSPALSNKWFRKRKYD